MTDVIDHNIRIFVSPVSELRDILTFVSQVTLLINYHENVKYYFYQDDGP